MIPEIIHQAWYGREIFDNRYYSSIIHYCPKFDYYFWNETSPKNAALPTRALRILEHPDYTVNVKSDILRLAALYIYGGIYLDTDVEVIRPLDNLLYEECFIGKESKYHDNDFGTAVIGAEPYHPTIAHLLEKVLDGLDGLDPHIINCDPLSYVSVRRISQLIKNLAITKYDFYFFYPLQWDKIDYRTPASYTVHHWDGVKPAGWCRQFIYSDGRRDPIWFERGEYR